MTHCNMMQLISTSHFPCFAHIVCPSLSLRGMQPQNRNAPFLNRFDSWMFRRETARKSLLHPWNKENGNHVANHDGKFSVERFKGLCWRILENDQGKQNIIRAQFVHLFATMRLKLQVQIPSWHFAPATQTKGTDNHYIAHQLNIHSKVPQIQCQFL